MTKLNLTKFRAELLKFYKESEEPFYLNWIGTLDSINVIPIYEKYKHLFTLEVIDEVRAIKPKNKEEARRLRYLLAFLMFQYTEVRRCRLNEEATNLESQLFIEFQGEKIPLRSLAGKIMNEPDRAKRLAMKSLRVKVKTEKILPAKEKIVQEIYKVAHELGFKNYVEMNGFLQDRSFVDLKKKAEKFLKQTDKVYTKKMDEFFRKGLGIKLAEADGTDFAFLRRAPKYDSFFPKEELLPKIKKTLAGMGFFLEKFKGLTLDLEARPKKLPRPAVMAINPPKDIRLTSLPLGGQGDYENLFHELGHVTHFAHMKSNLEFEYKFWGDRGLTEGNSYLYQHLPINPLWLADNTTMDKATMKAFVSEMHFYRLAALRRICGSFLYQYELFAGEKTAGMGRRYAEIMKRATAMDYPEDPCFDFDLELYIAGYMRAMVFETQLKKALERKVGPRWWNSRKSAAILKRFYPYGRKMTGEEILKGLGYKDLDFSFTAKDCAEMIGK